METFPHCQFDWPPFDNDTMLLKLNDTTKLNKYMQLLPLPDFFEDVEPGTLCQVAGWGDTPPGMPPKHLQKVSLKIVNRKSCDKHYASDPKITNNMLCVTGKSKLYLRDTSETPPVLTGEKGELSGSQSGDPFPKSTFEYYRINCIPKRAVWILSLMLSVLNPEETMDKEEYSGEPLICAGQYRGIFSFGEECENTSIPRVYMWLTEEYIEWIKRMNSSYTDP